jgi:hypothetical protein
MFFELGAQQQFLAESENMLCGHVKPSKKISLMLDIFGLVIILISNKSQPIDITIHTHLLS